MAKSIKMQKKMHFIFEVLFNVSLKSRSPELSQHRSSGEF